MRHKRHVRQGSVSGRHNASAGHRSLKTPPQVPMANRKRVVLSRVEISAHVQIEDKVIDQLSELEKAYIDHADEMRETAREFEAAQAEILHRND